MVGRELGLNLEINLQYFHIRGIFYLNNKFVFIVFHKKIVGKKKMSNTKLLSLKKVRGRKYIERRNNIIVYVT